VSLYHEPGENVVESKCRSLMYHFETSIRVRYAETDQMGYVYYGNYATYYEVTRVEALRSLGISYKILEENGVLMPVLENWSKYIRPAKYDDLLTIKLILKEMPAMRITFEYEVFNEDKKLINLGSTTLVFLDKSSGKPIQVPDVVQDVLKPYF
jgi:acyl-CoA thioester hydrolase